MSKGQALFEQAEDLMHFSYEASNEKFLSVDLEGEDYKLYDPDIAALEALIEARRRKRSFVLTILETQRLIILLQYTNAVYFVLS